MRPQKFSLAEETFHTEVGSWPGVVCEITEGRYTYLFVGMQPQPSIGEVTMSSMKREVEDELAPMFTQMEKHMSSLKQTIACFTDSLGKSTLSIAFQGSTLFNPIITTMLSVAIPHISPHA